MKTFKIVFLLLLTFTTNEASEYANNQYSSHQPSPTLCSVEQVLGRTFVLQVLGNLCIKIEPERSSLPEEEYGYKRRLLSLFDLLKCYIYGFYKMWNK